MMFKPHFRLLACEVAFENGIKKVIRTDRYLFTRGKIPQMREDAHLYREYLQSIESPDRLIEYIIEFVTWPGDLPREATAVIFSNDFVSLADGLPREAAYLERYTDADMPTISLLDAIGNKIDSAAIFGNHLKLQEYDEFPEILLDRAEDTVGGLAQRIYAFDQKRRKLAGEDVKIVGLNDLPF